MEKIRVERPRDYDIPNKLYFRIGEVSDLVGVKPYVLRYWESEFNDIKPSKSKSGQRLYKRRDVEMLLRIKELLYEERFTINGARKRLREFMRSDVKEPTHVEELEVEELEEVVDDPVEDVPRQHDIFSAMATHEGADPIESRPLNVVRPRKAVVANDPVATIAPGTGGGAMRDTKTLLKIRKDLEDLLTLLKA